MKTITTEETTDRSLEIHGKDSKGRFKAGNGFGGPRPNSGRKPMPEARKRALEAFHDALPEAVTYLKTCLESEDPEEKRWACELMIKKGIPGVEALLVHGQLEAKPMSVFDLPVLSPEAAAAIKEIADREADRI